MQVKSKTNQAQLNDYMERFSGRGEAKMFYVYHSAPKSLASDNPGVVPIGPSRLAEMVLGAGLFDWLLAKAG